MNNESRDMKLIMEKFRKVDKRLDEFADKTKLRDIHARSQPLFQQARDALNALVDIAEEALEQMHGFGPAGGIEAYQRQVADAARLVEEAYVSVNRMAEQL